MVGVGGGENGRDSSCRVAVTVKVICRRHGRLTRQNQAEIYLKVDQLVGFLCNLTTPQKRRHVENSVANVKKTNKGKMDQNRMAPCLQLPLDNKLLENVIEKAKDWALMHGACMRSRTNLNKDVLQFAPFVLLPSTFPRREFKKAVEIQPILNELVHKVAHDYEFLSSSLKSTNTVDHFTRRLFEIYETVRKDGITQPVSLGLVRSDIMLESTCSGKERGSAAKSDPYCCWKQVEINTIASGFGWLGPASGLIHRYTLELNSSLQHAMPTSLGLLRSDYLLNCDSGTIKQVEINTVASSFGGISTHLGHYHRYVLQELGRMDMIQNLPENHALQGLCQGMLEAWKLYNNEKAVIMFVVEDVTYNICDQRFHEFELRSQNPNVPVIRRNLTQISERAKLGSKKELILDDMEVGVIYFRAGYEPGHYHSENEWNARLLMERSRAIKCPSIYYHLAGTKKVQQALAKPGVLEKFLSPDKTSVVKEIFTGLYSLDKDEFGDRAVQMAIENPGHFVLKPQREGGGNNVYGDKVRTAVEAMKDSEERSAWILMERISPPMQLNYLVRPGDPNNGCPPLSDVVGELGIFGVVIGDSEKILVNKQVGHMLRTKLSTADEGGVAAGLGALDSPYLCKSTNKIMLLDPSLQPDRWRSPGREARVASGGPGETLVGIDLCQPN
ncbi:Hypothetical predicted protein [Cloeon dipterum]|uniref:Glutathione synthetase n=1 Tax=Cloeon dipterum TaxID=197152 RepID=A0A8S1C8R4_9INSE|nr:Hypothetical predicted protein [Cloeon dipterum]